MESLDPEHFQFRRRGKPYGRRVYRDGTQSPHGKGINKNVPKKVLKRTPGITIPPILRMPIFVIPIFFVPYEYWPQPGPYVC